MTFGVTKKMHTGCGNLYVTINEDVEGNPFEVFTQIGKAGGCAASQCEAIGRLVSLILRSGIPPKELVMQLKSISCHKPAGFGDSRIASCSDAVAKAIEWYVMYKINGNKKFGDVIARGIDPEAGGEWRGEGLLRLRCLAGADGRLPRLRGVGGACGRMCDLPRLRLFGVLTREAVDEERVGFRENLPLCRLFPYLLTK